MSIKIKKAIGTYGRALLACLLAEIAVVGIPSNSANLLELGNAIWVAFLPVIIRALNPNDSDYGIER